MDSSDLPESWAAVTLELVAEVHDNLREPVNSTERKGRVGPFPYYGATGQVGWIDDFRQDGEYVLLGEDGAPFFDPTKDKAYLVSGKCWVNNHAHVLQGREGVCLNRYLLYALNQVNYRGFANGTTRLKLTQAAMRQLPINLAPLAEQHRIVAKIEELFSELDQGVASLKTAREQLKVYRQSLLKNAFEGKLTAAWRAAHADQLETAAALQQRIARERADRHRQQLADWQANGQTGAKPKPPKPLPPLTAEELAELPELPVGWGWVRIGELVERVTVGYVGPMKNEYVTDGVAFLRSQNVRENRFDPDGLKFVSQAFHKSLSKSALSAGDVVVVRSGSIGVSCVIPEHLGEANCSDLVIVKSPRHVASHLLAYYMNWQTQGRVKQKMVGVALIHFNTKSVEGFAFPFCCEQEQQQIEKLLSEKLSEADQLDQTLATALQQIDALRQSILKRAFCGQLVKQDPNDESASALLERIRASRGASPAKGRQAKMGSKLLPDC